MMSNLTIAADNIIEINNQFWSLDYKRNVLFQMDFDYLNSKISLIPYAIFSKGKHDSYPKTYGKIISSNDKIYAIPEAPIPIAVYNIKLQKTYYIDFDIDYNVFPGKILSGAVCHKQFIYFVPCSYGSIIRLDTTDDSLKYYSLRDYYSVKPSFLFDGLIATDTGFYFSTYIGNKVLYFDYLTEKVVLECEIQNVDGICGLAGNSNKMIIVPIKADCLYKYKKNESNIEMLELFPNNHDMGNWSFSRIINKDNNYVLLPREAEYLYAFENDIISFYIKKENSERDDFYNKYYSYCNIEFYNDKYLVFSNNGMFVYDVNTQKLEEIKLFINHKGLCSMKDDEIFEEDTVWNLDWFLLDLSKK